MGMYDHVITPPIKCQACDNMLTGWQSKDRECNLDHLEYWEVENFYTFCGRCSTWNEYHLPREARQKIPLEAYKLVKNETSQ
jgi:hypothetical protein